MKDGHLSFDGEPNELMSNGKLQAIYETQFVTYTSTGSSPPTLAPCAGYL